LIDRSVPEGLDVHVILDDSSTNKTPGNPALAGASSPLYPALHADLQLLADTNGWEIAPMRGGFALFRLALGRRRGYGRAAMRTVVLRRKQP
jgi:hypothetical protein